MKAALIEVGKTYRNKTGNSAREVIALVEVTADLQRTGYVVDGDRAFVTGIGETATAVVYRQKRGSFIGSVSALSLQSFAAWASSEDDSIVAAGSKLARAVDAIEWMLKHLHVPGLYQSKADEIRALVKEIKK